MVKPSLELRHSQSLVMTEQLQQSIKLLQLSALELSEFIDLEIEKNPLLALEEPLTEEMESPSEESPKNDSDDDAQPYETSEAEPVDDAGFSRSTETSPGATERQAERIDANSDDIWGEESEASRFSGVSDYNDEGGGGSFTDAIEQRYSSKPSLKQHLMEQVQTDIPDSAQRLIAHHLIDLVDESGYMREKPNVIAAQLGASTAEVEEVLRLLQRSDPPGVFARDLKECLQLQLEERGLLDEPMKLLLANLDLMAEGDLKKLRKICNVEEAEFACLLGEIRELDPRPGSHFSVEEAETLIPDVFVKKVAREGWKVELNADVLPRLIVNRQYYALLSTGSRQKEDKKFLSEQLSNANWLIKSLDQRAQTLLKVGSEIVRQQEEFFEYGIHFLKPMTLKHIADRISVHESTVSRVTTGKYIASPRGVFEMKYFFSSSLSDSGSGDSYSSRTVMHMIKELVDQEKTEKILSDDTIAEVLQNRGIEVARRTVVKYRQHMHIPSSVERRREKRLKARAEA